jgi:hypothetical protein
LFNARQIPAENAHRLAFGIKINRLARMDTLILATFGLVMMSIATLRWLSSAPVGYEDTNGFHASLDAEDTAHDYPLRNPSQPPFASHGL